jgi:hypothetical protein
LFFTKDNNREKEEVMVIVMAKVYNTEPVIDVINSIRENIPKVRRTARKKIFNNVTQTRYIDLSKFMAFFGIDHHFEETPYDPDNPLKSGYWTNSEDRDRIEYHVNQAFEPYPYIDTWLRECVKRNGDINPDNPRTYEEFRDAMDNIRFSDAKRYAPKMTGHDDISGIGMGKGPVNTLSVNFIVMIIILE